MTFNAGTKLERFIEKEIEDFMFREGWSVETQGGDHLAIQYGDDFGSPDMTINISALARHLAEAVNA